MKKRYFILILICILLVSFLNIAFLYQYQFLIDALAGQNQAAFGRQVLLMCGTIAAMLLVEYGRQVSNETYLAEVGYHLQATLLGKIFTKTYLDYNKEEPGYYLSQVTNDIEEVKESHYDSFFSLFQGLCSFAIASLALLSLDPLTAALLVFTSFLPVLIPYAFRTKRRHLQNDLSKAQKAYHTHLFDHLVAFLEVKNLKPLPKLLETLNHSYLGTNSRALTLAKTTSGMNVLVGLAFYATSLVIVFVGGHQVLVGQLSLGGLTAILTISEQLVDPINSIADAWLNRHGIKDLRQAILDDEPTCSDQSQLLSLNTVNFTGLVIEQLHYELDGKCLFDQFSARFAPGQHSLIIGQSGRGKSTLGLLLTKNLPLQDGGISLNGQSFTDLSYEAVQTCLAYVPQTTHLFQASIRDNLTLGYQVSDQTLLTLLATMGLADRFPDSAALNEVVTDKLGISGGQKQRLVLIRALVQNKPVLLIDEGLSALDPETFAQVEAYLTSLMDRTVIHISHVRSEESLARYKQVIDLT